MPFGAPNPKEQQIPLRFKIFVHPYMKRRKSVPRPGVSISTDDQQNTLATLPREVGYVFL